MHLLYQPLSLLKEQIYIFLFCTYTPGHEVGESPIILFMKKKMTNPAAEGLLVVFVVDDLEHSLRVARP